MTPSKDLPDLDDLDLDVGAGAGAPRKSGFLARAFRFFIGMAIAFGAGAGWQYFESLPLRGELTSLRQEVRYQRLGATLSNARVEAGAGRYESARGHASAFFTELQGLVYEPEGDVPEGLEALLGTRDDVITALSRSEPRSRDMLDRLLGDYTRITGQSAFPVAAPEAGEPSPASGASGSPEPAAAPADTTPRAEGGETATPGDSAAAADTVRDTIPG